METQIEQVQLMSQTLESSGFSPQQSNAVIKSVALAMQTFAVTPEVLDQVLDRRLGQLKTELKAEILAEVPSRTDFKKQGDDIKERGRDIRDLNKSMNRAFEKRDEEIKDLNKSVNRLERFILGSGITFIALALTALGLIVRLLSQLS